MGRNRERPERLAVLVLAQLFVLMGCSGAPPAPVAPAHVATAATVQTSEPEPEQAIVEENLNQVYAGSLDTSDPVLPNDGSFFDSYPIDVMAGWAVVIELNSDEFDPYLHFRGLGDFEVQNDDANGLNSRIVTMIPETGTYTVIANSYSEQETGAYELRIEIDPTGDLAAHAQEEP